MSESNLPKDDVRRGVMRCQRRTGLLTILDEEISDVREGHWPIDHIRREDIRCQRGTGP